MNRNEFGLTKNFTADGAIPPRRVVIFAATEGRVAKAVSATAAPFVGVTGQVGATAAGQRIDIHLDGVRLLEGGAAFAQGVDLTVDAEGRVIAAAPAASTVNRVIGQALEPSTALGHLVAVRVAPGSYTRTT